MNNEELKIDFKHRQFEDSDFDTTRTSIRPEDRNIDRSRNRYPFCIVWTPIPGLTTLFPFLGHVGICNKNGVIHDFSGSYNISVDDMAFGNPERYIALDPDDYSAELWDQAIDKANNKFRNEVHNLAWNNCHSYCAHVLNLVRYKGKNDWNMLDIWWMTMFNSQNVKRVSPLKTYGVTLIFFIMVLIIIFSI